MTVSNAGPALAIGNKFTLFDHAVQNGAGLTVTGGGATWNNNLAVDGSISVTGFVVPPPVITSVELSGSSLVFSGGSGTAGNTYYVLSSTNLTLPLTNWTRELTNTFGTGGSFSVTNPIGTGVPQKFYLLQLP